MRLRQPSRLEIRPRALILVLTLVSHLMVALGFPMPGGNDSRKEASQFYPCQDRPCGCGAAELCWAGDCCCFTLEQKLDWADANGIEPPEHVRRMVNARKARPAASKPKSCCEDAAQACFDEPKKPPVRWVAGVFVQKCRGEVTGVHPQLDPAIVPDTATVRLTPVTTAGQVRTRSDRAVSVPHLPPTPPPRHA